MTGWEWALRIAAVVWLLIGAIGTSYSWAMYVDLTRQKGDANKRRHYARQAVLFPFWPVVLILGLIVSFVEMARFANTEEE